MGGLCIFLSLFHLAHWGLAIRLVLFVDYTPCGLRWSIWEIPFGSMVDMYVEVSRSINFFFSSFIHESFLNLFFGFSKTNFIVFLLQVIFVFIASKI